MTRAAVPPPISRIPPARVPRPVLQRPPVEARDTLVALARAFGSVALFAILAAYVICTGPGGWQ